VSGTCFAKTMILNPFFIYIRITLKFFNNLRA
jgi:hypothetical protein